MKPLGNSVLILSKTDNRRLVAVHRPENRAKVCLPGGKQEPYENSLSGAIREVYEETGIVLNGNQLVPFYSDFCMSQGANYWVTTYLTFIEETDGFSPVEFDTFPEWMEAENFLKNSYYREYYLTMFGKLKMFFKQ